MKKLVATITTETGERKWEEFEEIDFSVGFENINGVSSREYNVPLIIKSFNKWREFIEKPYNTYLIGKYNEQYFENKSIIFYACIKPNIIEKMNVVKVKKSLTTVYLQINVRTGFGEAMSVGNLVIEVDKNSINHLNHIDLVETD